ncbi:MAG: extracellular solute-binding protein [Chloroflexi bacterium]|nr:extracellular solute-binding protein [Chloroflexota bacterium]
MDEVQASNHRTVTRRGVLKMTAAGALGIGASSLLGTSAAAASENVFSAPQLQASKITFLVNSGDGDKVRGVAPAYTASTGTQVDVLELPYDQSFQKLQIALSQKSDAYDLASLDDPWIPQFAGGKFLALLDDLYAKTGTQPNPDFQPQLFGLGDWPKGSGLRAVPWLGNVQVFAWRNDLIDQRPNTWDDVVATAQKIVGGSSGVYGYGIRGAAGNPATTSFLPITRGYGKDVLSPTFVPQLDTPEALSALNTALKLRDAAPPGAENTQHADNGRNMYTGAIAMSGDIWPDQLLQIFDPSLSNVVGLVSIGPQPAQSGVSPANMTGTWLLGIPGGSKNADRAFDFMNWFTQLDQQKKLLMQFSVPPTLTPLFNDPEAAAKFPFLPGLLDAATKAVPRPRTQYYSGVEDIIGRYLSQAIAGQIDAEGALNQANTEVRDFLVRNGQLS